MIRIELRRGVAPSVSMRALKRVGVASLVAATLGLAYGLFAPRWYRSTLTLVPAKPPRLAGGISSVLGGDMGALASGLESVSGGGAEPARIAAVLESNAVTDGAIEKFGLAAHYRAKHIEGAREALWRHCGISLLPKPNLVQMSCEDKDPARAKALLEFFAERGNQVFRKVNVGSASEEVRVLEARVAELRERADDTSKQMREFQERHRIVDLDAQAKAVVSSLADLNRQRIGKQMELSYGRTFASADEPSLQQLESQLSVVTRKLRTLEQPTPEGAGTDRSPEGDAGDRGVFPRALDVPRLRADFEKLYRDRRVAEASLVFALERLESAKAAEARDVSTFLVLDPPTLATKASRPKPLLATFVAAIAGLVLAGFVEWLRGGGWETLSRLSDRGGRDEAGSTDRAS